VGEEGRGWAPGGRLAPTVVVTSKVELGFRVWGGIGHHQLRGGSGGVAVRRGGGGAASAMGGVGAIGGRPSGGGASRESRGGRPTGVVRVTRKTIGGVERRMKCRS
jgi:hypothetical protein